jgi:hypothetical protein
METDPIELARRAYEEWNWFGTEAFGRFRATPCGSRMLRSLPDAGTWQGRDSVLERLDDAREGISVGDVFHIVAVEGRKLGSIRVFRSREDAERAAQGGETS